MTLVDSFEAGNREKKIQVDENKDRLMHLI